jgi:hypothetical protein
VERRLFMRRVSLLAIAALVLAACAQTPTGYSPSADDGVLILGADHGRDSVVHTGNIPLVEENPCQDGLMVTGDGWSDDYVRWTDTPSGRTHLFIQIVMGGEFTDQLGNNYVGSANGKLAIIGSTTDKAPFVVRLVINGDMDAPGTEFDYRFKQVLRVTVNSRSHEIKKDVDTYELTCTGE